MKGALTTRSGWTTAFVEAMDRKLRTGGENWDDVETSDLLGQLREELALLERSVERFKRRRERFADDGRRLVDADRAGRDAVRDAAAQVANFAMMVAESCGAKNAGPAGDR